MVIADVGIAFDLDGEGGTRKDVGLRYITCRKAAVDYYSVAESEVVAVRVPLGLSLFIVRSFVHITIKIYKEVFFFPPPSPLTL